MSTRRTHRLDLSIDAASWMALYLDSEFTRGLYLEGLDFSRCDELVRDVDGENIRRQLRLSPPITAPKAVQKVLGPTQEYVEHGALTGGVYRYEIKPSTLADRIKSTGELSARDTGSGCSAQFDAVFDVSIFGVGGAVERFMAGQFEESMRRQDAFVRRWIASH